MNDLQVGDEISVYVGRVDPLCLLDGVVTTVWPETYGVKVVAALAQEYKPLVGHSLAIESKWVKQADNGRPYSVALGLGLVSTTNMETM